MVTGALVASVILRSVALAGPFTANWTNYPHLWSKTTAKKWLVIKCKLPDKPEIAANLDQTINYFFTQVGARTGNIQDYYSDVSYGRVSLGGTKVVGWYPSGYSSTFGTNSNRQQRVETCANQIPASKLAKLGLSHYWGIVIVANQPNDSGACYDGQQPLTIHGTSYNLACVTFDRDSMFTAFAAHEIGHGLGYPHSFDAAGSHCGGQPGEYCDPWDIMSALLTYFFPESNYVTFDPCYGTGSASPCNLAGPGVNVPNLLHQGWIPASQIAKYRVGDPATSFTLTALSHPSSSGVLTVEIPAVVFDVTVEYRQQDGWDAGIPANAVVVHIYEPTVNPYSFLMDQGLAPPSHYPGALLAGETLTEPAYSIKVNSIDPGSGTASVTISPGSGS
jgi:M6 family metalloprotease-like protein